MAIFNQIRTGIADAGKFALAGARKAGKAIHQGAKIAYQNRDLVARGIAIGAPIVAGGIAGGGVGALGAGLAQKDKIKGLISDVRKRVQGKTKGGDVDEATKKELTDLALDQVRKKISKPVPIEEKRKAVMDKRRLKVLAEGQEI